MLVKPWRNNQTTVPTLSDEIKTSDPLENSTKLENNSLTVCGWHHSRADSRAAIK